LRSCRTLGLKPDERCVTAHPISIDPEAFVELARTGPVVERERRFEATRLERMILRVDRTDPAKNVPRGLEAFARLLERRPDLRGRVGMLALLDPSRQEIPEYVEERRRIEEAAAGVDAAFPGALTLEIADDFAASVAGYKQFDVLLVNAVMDGLNLVSKEAPTVNERAGVVALSVNAGAYEELADWVVPVEPLDVEATVDALEEALSLPEDERRARQEALREHVREHDLSRWIAAQLADLDRATSIRRR
jgi:trehalose 6-phosphate synthase